MFDLAEDIMQRFLIGLGIVVLLGGLLWPLLSKIGIGRLPGDIAFQRGNVTFFFPLASSILLSVALSLILWLFNR